jgi:tRNA pseudouridine55 synthase
VITDACGILVVDKPGGITSHDVVARARRVLGTRKVGHAGTLDPMATGVLILGAGRATRLLGHLALRDKRYLATIRLGASTVTDDVEGDVVSTADAAALAAVADHAIDDVLRSLTGVVEQRPSSVSAVKVDGRRAYDRVRSGEEVVLAPRTVEIGRIDVLARRRSPDAVDLDIDVECSTGTYVRAIARDLGDALGVGGHLTALRRTRVGPFDVAAALSLDELAERGRSALIGLDEVAPACFPVWALADDDADSARMGRRIPWAGPGDVDGPVALLSGAGEFLALATDDAGTARYVAVFA